jgi:hypothetical protein
MAEPIFKIGIQTNVGAAEVYRYMRQADPVQLQQRDGNKFVVRILDTLDILEMDLDECRVRSLINTQNQHYGNAHLRVGCILDEITPDAPGYNPMLFGYEAVPNYLYIRKRNSLLRKALGERFNLTDVRTEYRAKFTDRISESCTAIATDIKSLKLFDRSVFRLYADLTGADKEAWIHLDLWEFSYLWKNMEKIQEVCEKLPPAAPFIVKHMRSLSVTERRSADLNLMHLLPEYIKKVWKLNPLQWKVFCKLTRKQAAQYFKNESNWSFPRSILFDVYADTGKFPKITGCNAVSKLYRNPREDGGRVADKRLLDRLVRVALGSSIGAVNVTQWSANEFDQIADWFKNEGYKIQEPDKNQLRMSWTGFVRRSTLWHVDVGQRKIEGEDLDWTSLVGEIKIPEHNLRVVALCSTHQLQREGYAMKHCVGQYSPGCIRNESRIFSIRALDTDNRLSTLQITRNAGDGMWRVTQIKGKRNSAVSEEQKQLAKAVAGAYNEKQIVFNIDEKRRIALEKEVAAAEEARIRAEANALAREAQRAKDEADRVARLREQNSAMSLLEGATIDTGVVALVDRDNTEKLITAVNEHEQEALPHAV